MNKLPVINCISNIVSANDCANILLAAGFSPIMADEPKEAEDIAEAADALVINLGTPSDRKYEAANAAGRAYNRLGKPVVIDPVGVAVSSYRREKLAELLMNVHPDVIRCNLNEAKAMIGLSPENASSNQTNLECGATEDKGITAVTSDCGIDSREDEITGHEEAAAAAKALAKMLGCIVLISGAVDVISDGTRCVTVSGGSDRLKQITGSGCMLSALTGGFAARASLECSDLFTSVCEVSVFFKQAAEKAEAMSSESRNGGLGELHIRLIDAVSI